MTKLATAVCIGVAVGAGILLAGCQLPNLSATNRTSVTVESSPVPDTGTSPSDVMTTKPTPVTNTTVDQDLQSLDSLSKQTNPTSLGADSASNANLGVQ